MSQIIITANSNYAGLDTWIQQTVAKTVLLVCDESIRFLKDISAHFERVESRGIRFVRFSDFQPNPLYESVAAGVQAYLRNGCSAIIAVGGGSAMDVAKCIKLFSNMDHGKNYLEQTIVPNTIPFLAIPTTAGTGSEATRYAVIYYNDAKQSVTSESIIPEAVLLDPGVLKTLPAYQKKSTMMDAFCHALGRKLPPLLDYLGKVLTAAAIAMLCVYSYAGLADFSHPEYRRLLLALPATAVTIALHLLARNPMLSICGGTACYMLLLHAG